MVTVTLDEMHMYVDDRWSIWLSTIQESGQHNSFVDIDWAPQEEYHPPSIFIEQSEPKAAHKFSYLGCIPTSDAKIDKEMDSS